MLDTISELLFFFIIIEAFFGFMFIRDKYLDEYMFHIIIALGLGILVYLMWCPIDVHRALFGAMFLIWLYVTSITLIFMLGDEGG